MDLALFASLWTLACVIVGMSVGYRMARGMSPVANPLARVSVTQADPKNIQKIKPQESL